MGINKEVGAYCVDSYDCGSYCCEGPVCCQTGETCASDQSGCIPPGNDDDDGLSTTNIVLIVVGACAGVVLGAAILWVVRNRYGKRQQYDRV
ncbi:uncharacterized protein ACA1_035320 [Acanthamoeba castellanii str. Neff]|uniref:Uncharacterized protein n=1 Tax=Acanthamoeba castellanii (strain ATCC 30010 / Neff) TaxID=1257118 RepID=L8HAE0_ACACF|nr:uncharacterized protein ACA1_035320 [Acanthamoeba castellanii str. Neff]ELR22202.1 hypothetical protein ACA1_035320 [Acanthamoeba castellanii str. Neff]